MSRYTRYVLVLKEVIPSTDPDAPKQYKIVGYYAYKFMGTPTKGYAIMIVPREEAYIFPTAEHAETLRAGDDRLKSFVVEPA